MLLLGPPLGFATVLLRRRFAGVRLADPQNQRAVELLAKLRSAGQEGSDELQLALREYLGMRLGLPAASLTFVDVAPALRERGASDDTLKRLERVFNSFEARRYAAGAAAELTPAEAAELAGEACQSLEEMS